MHLLLRTAAMLWASPCTLFGLVLGAIGLCTGGGVRIRWPAVEFYGGFGRWLLNRFGGYMAITFGHVVLGLTEAALDIAHDHEMVHVRQYERWGLAMWPAYLGCSLVLWLRGRRPYEDNPFERQAFDETGERR
jgi:hypothetical protein